MKKMFVRAGLAAVALIAIFSCSQGLAQIAHNDEFVQKSGTKLTLGGEDFRYSGPNIEWLGLESYGPHDPIGPRYPSHFEVDDALDTAKAMGARVVRSQTLGDSVNCELCIEPKEGVFNPEAFKSIDYSIKAAHDRGLRLIVTLAGDCATCALSGPGQYLIWTGKMDFKPFYTDPVVIAAFEKHIEAMLNHKNSLTGIAYKNDPTIMAWENCNVCGLGAVWTAPGQSLAPFIPWVDTIGSFIKSIDKRHLYIDNSGFFQYDKSALDNKTPDIITAEYYQHWDAMLGSAEKTNAQTFSKHAELVNAHGKVYVVEEYGWDATDWATRDDFEAALHAMETDPRIVGDNYWALQAHTENFGWQPIPANVTNPVYAKMGESGHWWSLYYGGMKTMVNTAEDMQARAEQLRTHAYKMAGTAVPAHAVPPAPVVTVKGLGFMGWRGSAGAVVYSVQRKLGDKPWETICDKCATDADSPWIIPKPGAPFSEHYRVIAYNADGVASEPSAVR